MAKLLAVSVRFSTERILLAIKEEMPIGEYLYIKLIFLNKFLLIKLTT